MIAKEVPVKVAELDENSDDMDFIEIVYESSASKNDQEKIDITEMKVEPIDYTDIKDVFGNANILPISHTKEEITEENDIIKNELDQNVVEQIHEKSLVDSIQKAKINIENTCKVCDRIFPNKYNLKAHLNKIHKNPIIRKIDMKQFKCETCMKCFSRKDALVRHLRNVHQKTLRTRDNNMIEYLKSSYYYCDICHKAFPTYLNLKDHVAALHHQIEALQCDICEEVFESRKGLQDHTNSNHNSSIEKCQNCTKWFSKTSMKRHDCQNIAKIERKLKQRLLTSYELKNKCQFCPKAFGSENKLRMHLKLSCKEFKNRIELLKCGKIHSLLEIVI